VVAAVVAVAIAALVAGCSTERSLDRATLEAEVAAQLLPDYPGLVTAVTCPDLAEPAPLDRFDCQAMVGAQNVSVAVELGGTLEELTAAASVDARLVAASEVAALLSATFGDEIGIQTGVDCGQPVVALPEDEPVRCSAIDPTGVVRQFDVTVGADGALQLRLR
jgi:hypothetical protein